MWLIVVAVEVVTLSSSIRRYMTMNCDLMCPKQVLSNELVRAIKICRFTVIRSAIQAITGAQGAGMKPLLHQYFYHF